MTDDDKAKPPSRGVKIVIKMHLNHLNQTKFQRYSIPMTDNSIEMNVYANKKIIVSFSGELCDARR